MEWHAVQTTSALVWLDTRMFARLISLEWQPRQESRIAAGGSSEYALMDSLPPLAATCRLPGPWQPSQPTFSGGSVAAAAIDLLCGLRENFKATSGWHGRQTALPTKPCSGAGLDPCP